MNDQQEKTKLWKLYAILMAVMVGGALLIIGGQAVWNALQQNRAKVSIENQQKSNDSSALNTPSSQSTMLSQPLSSAPSVSMERVNFSSGSTGATIRDNLTRNQLKRYLLWCSSGQRMIVQVKEGNVKVVVIAPNGQKIGTAMNSTNQWDGQLPSDGDYTIEVSTPNQSAYRINVEVL